MTTIHRTAQEYRRALKALLIGGLALAALVGFPRDTHGQPRPGEPPAAGPASAQADRPAATQPTPDELAAEATAALRQADVSNDADTSHWGILTLIACGLVAALVLLLAGRRITRGRAGDG